MAQYKFKSSARIKANPQLAGEMCEKLAAENNLTAKALLDANRPEDAPLHNAFEWNDSIASEKWREHQARNIINSLVIVSEEREPVRAYFNIEVKSPVYSHIGTILSDPADTQALLLTAYRELLAFRRKYSQLAQLAQVFAAVDQLKIAQ